MVLEKTLENPLDCKKIQPVHPKGDQSWVFTGRTDVEAETPILWPRDAKNWLIWNDPDAGKDWRQEEKGTIEDEMDGWMVSLTQWTWFWVDSSSWWWTGRPGMLWFMELQRVGHDWVTELKTPHEAEDRHSFWGMNLLCSPLCWLRVKANFLYPPVFLFYLASVNRESQDFGPQK